MSLAIKLIPLKEWHHFEQLKTHLGFLSPEDLKNIPRSEFVDMFPHPHKLCANVFYRRFIETCPTKTTLFKICVYDEQNQTETFFGDYAQSSDFIVRTAILVSVQKLAIEVYQDLETKKTLDVAAWQHIVDLVLVLKYNNSFVLDLSQNLMDLETSKNFVYRLVDQDHVLLLVVPLYVFQVQSFLAIQTISFFRKFIFLESSDLAGPKWTSLVETVLSGHSESTLATIIKTHQSFSLDSIILSLRDK
jgi:hypothetical protein